MAAQPADLVKLQETFHLFASAFGNSQPAELVKLRNALSAAGLLPAVPLPDRVECAILADKERQSWSFHYPGAVHTDLADKWLIGLEAEVKYGVSKAQTWQSAWFSDCTCLYRYGQVRCAGAGAYTFEHARLFVQRFRHRPSSELCYGQQVRRQ